MTRRLLLGLLGLYLCTYFIGLSRRTTADLALPEPAHAEPLCLKLGPLQDLPKAMDGIVELRRRAVREIPKDLVWGLFHPPEPEDSNVLKGLIALGRSLPIRAGSTSESFFLSNPMLLAGLDFRRGAPSVDLICRSAVYAEDSRKLEVTYEVSPASLENGPLALVVNVSNALDWGFYHYDFSTERSTGFDLGKYPPHLTCNQRYTLNLVGQEDRLELVSDDEDIPYVLMKRLPAKLNLQFWIKQSDAPEPGSAALSRSVEVEIKVNAGRP